ELTSTLAMGKEFQSHQEKEIQRFFDLHGLEGKPDIPEPVTSMGDTRAPWMLAVQDAKTLRNYLGWGLEPIPNGTLFDALGVREAAVESYKPENTSRVSVAIP